ncbi:MAG: hypothetical protein K2H98_01850 [Duncaniella sp.]|nr:hypothetical protein [Duncaniella sp.]
MSKIKSIPHPDFSSAQKLTPLQLNAFRCEKKHTLLTPAQLEKIARQAAVAPNSGK